MPKKKKETKRAAFVFLEFEQTFELVVFSFRKYFRQGLFHCQTQDLLFAFIHLIRYIYKILITNKCTVNYFLCRAGMAYLLTLYIVILGQLSPCYRGKRTI